MSLYDALLILKGLGERAMAELQISNIHNGNILAMMLNLTPRKNNKTYSWTDFYHDINEDKKSSREMTGDEIHEQLHAMFGGLNNAA